MKDELSEVPPETNLDLQDLGEEDWRKYREEQNARLMEVAAESRVVSEVCPASTIQGVNTRTTASTIKSSTIKSSRIGRSTAVPFERDQQNLMEMFNFQNNDPSWKVPIIEFKDKILDIVGGKISLPPCYLVLFVMLRLSR